MPSCDREPTGTFLVDLAQEVSCGVGHIYGLLTGAAVDVSQNAEDALIGVSGNVAGGAADVAESARGAAVGTSANVARAAGPGLGLGLGAGAVVALVGTAILIDVVAFRGAGTRSVVASGAAVARGRRGK